jgi:replicative DNA helicase
MVEMLCRMPETSRVLVFSTEMTETQIFARMVAAQTGFHAQVIRSGRISHNNVARLEEVEADLGRRNFYIYDNLYEIGEIGAKIRKAHLQKGVDVVFVDYAQNCRVNGAKAEYDAMREVATRCQQYAKEMHCCLVLLSQLSNSAATDEDKMEFKGAGEFGAVADVAIRLMRRKENKKIVRWVMQKNRHGEKKDHDFLFANNWTRLVESAEVKL